MQGNVVFWLFFSQRSPTPPGDPGKPSGLGGFFPIFFSFVPQPSPLPGTAQGNVAEFPLFSQKTSTTNLKSRKIAAFVEFFSSLLHFHGRTFIPVWNHKKNAAFSSGISGFLPKKLQQRCGIQENRWVWWFFSHIFGFRGITFIPVPNHVATMQENVAFSI